MKKLLPVLFILMTTISLSAQDFSIRGGINLATLRGDDVIDGDNIIGWYVGPSVDLGLGVTTLDISLLYGRRGADNSMGSTSIKLDYLDIPVLLKFNLGIVYAEIGPYASILLSASAGDLNIKDLLNSADYGAMAIGGVVLGNIGFELKYLLGFNDIWNDEMVNIKNGSFSVGLRYCF